MSEQMSGFAQAYGEAFAGVYDKRWGFFSDMIAPQLIDLFRGESGLPGSSQDVVDVCCGSGHLARHFLDADFTVVGIDLSAHMLRHARANNEAAIKDGRAHFIEADAREFTIETPVTFAVALFDSLNHLPDDVGLTRALDRVFAALRSPGMFVFDLNTPRGLERWNSISVEESEDLTLINRGIHAVGATHAFTSITGFIRTENGNYERFSEQAYNTVFDIGRVPEMVNDAGFADCYAAHGKNLAEPVDDPSALRRAFFVCRKR